MEYRGRVADTWVAQALQRAPVVVLEGPHGVGLTTSARRIAGHRWQMASDEYAHQLVDMSPQLLFAERPPVLFEDWPETPRLLDQIRRHLETGNALAPGALLLAGARTPRQAELRETFGGAVAWVRMRPMSLWESGRSTGRVSLGALFDGERPEAPDPGIDARDLFELMVVGGWPALLGVGEEKARRWLRDHLLALVRSDLPAQGARRDADDLRRFMASVASGVGSEQKLAQVARAMDTPGGVKPRAETVREYLAALDRLLLLEDVPAWAPTLTSAAALRRGARRFFTDPSVGLASLGTGSAGLRKDLPLAARHFEALVVRDLRTYSEAIGGRLHHLRDNNGRTVDLVVELADGAWGGLQVRMNPAGVDDAVKGLHWVAAKIDRERHPAPAFLAVITGTGEAVLRDDGVLAVPIGALSP